ncbi:DmsC/YnfH family molybdoenzyme membrane anchor subunit [uncultured Adlercreutzia sp.]|uniref:dimethyl sulfoxide reductase anchor subunit family protein n=2 Tax=uncultured Adlercreutzia sp. TaxID=875803 RepID=UPI0025E90316|nr:DmsC/YnfH family molybdoenzyme membrane anchor subunit [uncultured Adlercreutzia sp.]
MELQWPLILFTTFVAWCAGTFATQAYLALRGKGEKIQFTCWIVSAVLLVIGGIAVFLHLEHWERIFNGFGHLTSGITQEFIAIVVLAVIALIYLVMIKRNDGKVPAWCAICAIVASVALVFVAGHSYLMEARPAWDNMLWVVSLLGAGCIMGPATVAAVSGFMGEDASELSPVVLIGSIVNAVASVAAAISINMASVSEVGYYYDLTHPTKDITASVDSLNVFAGESALMMIVGVLIIGCVAPIVCAVLGKKMGNWKVWGTVAAVCGAIGAICLRGVFYTAGLSVFAIF